MYEAGSMAALGLPGPMYVAPESLHTRGGDYPVVAPGTFQADRLPPEAEFGDWYEQTHRSEPQAP